MEVERKDYDGGGPHRFPPNTLPLSLPLAPSVRSWGGGVEHRGWLGAGAGEAGGSLHVPTLCLD